MDFAAPDDPSLLLLQGLTACIGIRKLDEAVCLLDGDLCNRSILVENVEEISLGYSLRRKVSDKKSRSLRKAIPVPFCDVNALLTEKFVVLLLDLGRPRRLYVPHDQLLPTMPFRPDTLMFPLRRGIRLGLLLLLRLLEGGARRRG